MDEKRWYLIHCRPRQDERALENLERQNFHCYRPVRLVERIRARRKSTVPEPLFPRYLFIQLDSVNDNWYPIRSTRGVCQLVCFNSEPTPVPDGVIDGIRARLRQLDVAEPCLKLGERVRITEGPFSQLEAIFLANDGDERVVLLLNIVQTEQRLVFSAHSVQKVE